MSTNTSIASVREAIGSSTFTATLLDNPTVSAFRSLLPLDMQMTELNGNEKYFDLPSTLPTAATDPGRIEVGNLMLYGSRTLVLWYKEYSTSYTYTRIGHIGDANGLITAVGSGGVRVQILEADNNTSTTVSVPRPSTVTNQASKTTRNIVLRPERLLMFLLGLTVIILY